MKTLRLTFLRRMALLCVALFIGAACVGTSLLPGLELIDPTPTKICGMTWVYGEDADKAQEIRAALEAAGIAVISVTVKTDGEDGFCTQNGTQTSQALIRYYAPEIVVPSAGGTAEEIGNRVADILRAIEPVPFLYTRDIQIGFQRPDGLEFFHWHMDLSAAYQAVKAGKTGVDLYTLGQ